MTSWCIVTRQSANELAVVLTVWLPGTPHYGRVRQTLFFNIRRFTAEIERGCVGHGKARDKLWISASIVASCHLTLKSLDIRIRTTGVCLFGGPVDVEIRCPLVSGNPGPSKVPAF